ncbi:hypothetical protein PtA15_6A629 [Puccinia triticina]|uniref:Uncharacterized protein n=1 Tax=Puccinia triticina TaxID=208348 RepID=A0ABY7CLH6_9BASI|nr:uncharacterized protein PtA15_6A629 [Puccinia triticina]WAQ85999.1 hypothetical protein PtA15_6A629 [Puccinia triticina]
MALCGASGTFFHSGALYRPSGASVMGTPYGRSDISLFPRLSLPQVIEMKY